MFEKIKRALKVKKLNRKQKKINKKYAKEGLTDEILAQQVELNKLRHELDIPDANNIIYDKYVQ